MGIFKMTEEIKAQKVVTMEDILNKADKSDGPNNETIQPATNKNKRKTNQDTIIKGKPNSGRFWKSEKKKFSTIIKTRGIKSSFEKKQALREKLQKMKEVSRELKAKKKEEEELRKQRRRDNLKRQEENRKKSEIVQVITNTKKLKKMKKKQLRYIEKRDTTTIVK